MTRPTLTTASDAWLAVLPAHLDGRTRIAGLAGHVLSIDCADCATLFAVECIAAANADALGEAGVYRVALRLGVLR